MVEDALPITVRILHDLAVASRFGNRDRDLGVRLYDYFLCCDDSGTQPCSRASFIFFVTFFSLPPLVSLAGAVDGGGAERAVKDASGEGGCEGSRPGLGAGRPGAGRPVVGGLPGVLSTKV